MWVPFETLPASSRIWIYQANRALTPAEAEDLAATLTHFCNDWQTHGQPMRASFKIEDSYFVILAVDEDFQLPSGCSLDGSVRVLKNWQAQNQIDFFNRTLVPFVRSGQIELLPMSELRKAAAEGIITPQTLTFNHLVPSKGNWEAEWKKSAADTWLSKYFAKTPVAGTP